MSNVEHANLTGSALHEPKGVGSASASTVYVADGVGSGSWTTLTLASLASTAKAFETQLLHVRDQQTSGTAGGNFISGAWRTRTLNTTAINGISGASLASNQVTLPAGTYFTIARAPAYIVNKHKTKLYNVTDASDTILGSNARCDSGAGAETDSWVFGTFTIASAKVFELRHYCETTSATQGFGFAQSIGVVEVYAEALFWKIA